MTNRDALTVSSRASLRQEIEQHIQQFLSAGGRIEVLQGPPAQTARPIGPVWWDTRGNGPVALNG
jgi:hypothetical protein